jgi:N6-L-threonylcarbamoyladenine synthase
MELLGRTSDDAAGEAFDKVAKLLELGYPGGPLIEKLARQGRLGKVVFQCSKTKQPLDFSFSGIKTAVMYYLRKNPPARRSSSVTAADIAASFQDAAVKTLVEKSLSACAMKKVDRLVIGGGVAANGRLRQLMGDACAGSGIKVYFPPKGLCIDNAAMVAGLGYRLFRKGHLSGLDLTAVPKLWRS